MIKFKKVSATPLSRTPAKVLIRWEMNNVKPADLADYEFCVVRQNGAEDGKPNFQDVDIDGNLKTPVAPALNPTNLQPISVWIDGLDFPWYVDYSDNLRNLTTVSNYRVKCRHKKTLEECSSEQFSWEGTLDLVGLYICEEHNFLLKDVTGSPSVVFKRRRGGIQCSCVDPIQKKRTVSNCSKCYGTNWLGGFFKPIDTYIDFNPNPKNAQIVPWGEIQENQTNALLSNYPSIEPGDVIRELPEMRMWRVENVVPTEKRRCQMLQFAKLVEIKPGDIEYTLHNDERFHIKKIEEFEAIKHKPEF